MAGWLLEWDDLEGLRGIAEGDEDPQCRRDARRALARLPLDEAAVGQALALLPVNEDAELRRAVEEQLRAARESVRATAQTVARAAASARANVDVEPVVEAIRAGILGDGQFPERLTALQALADEDARDLLSALVTLLLTSADQSEGALRRATMRLGAVVDALQVGRGRDVTAALPFDLRLRVDGVDDSRRIWAGGLLTLVEPAEILEAVFSRLEHLAGDERRTALRQLASAAPRIGRPRPLPANPGASARDDELLRLYTLLEPVVSGPRPTRFATGEAQTPSEMRTAYARLDAPGRVDPGAAFELRVGLAESPTPGVTQPPAGMKVPKSAFTLTIQLLADGFEALGDGSLVREIQVTEKDPFPYEMLRLRALDGPTLRQHRVITAVFLREGGFLGVASRVVRVAEAGEGPDDTPDPAPGGPLTLTVGARPDLEIIVARGNDAAGRRLSWSCRSQHGAPEMTVAPVWIDLGSDVPSDVRNLFQRVEDEKRAAGQREFINGLGMRVGRAVPGEIWTALRAAARMSSTPTVLLVTADPDVPWELAISPDRRDQPHPLGARAVVGRWMYSERGCSPLPAATIIAKTMAVTWGEYPNQKLPEAKGEAAELRRKYRARPVAAEICAILDCLRGTPSAEIVHFALHGKFDHTGTQDGILMQDEFTYLTPTHVEGVEPGLREMNAKTPVRMVFLNACQVGMAGRVFGEYSGMAPALIRLGIGAVVAPLWKVDDLVASTVGKGFYEEVLGPDDVSPAEYLRVQRASARGSEGATEGDRLAYVFYGHPLLRVSWARERNDSA